MAYATIDDIRSTYDMLSTETQSPVADSVIEQARKSAEQKMVIDLSNRIDFALIPDVSTWSEDDYTTYALVNFLSCNLSVANVIARRFGDKRKLDESSDLQYFSRMYRTVCDAVIKGSTQVPSEYAKSSGIGEIVSTNEEPLFGMNKYGEYEEDA